MVRIGAKRGWAQAAASRRCGRFVTPHGDARWYLTRIMITCCAADSRSYLVAVDGGGRPPVANTWQRVTGTWVASPPVDGRPTAWIAATAVTAVPAPAEPYELP